MFETLSTSAIAVVALLAKTIATGVPPVAFITTTLPDIPDGAFVLALHGGLTKMLQTATSLRRGRTCAYGSKSSHKQAALSNTINRSKASRKNIRPCKVITDPWPAASYGPRKTASPHLKTLPFLKA